MNPSPSGTAPVFIHSLFRSGSTYLFQKFRASKQFYCYQEPFNEELIELNLHPQRLLKSAAADSEALRHPRLHDPYFHEFYLARHALKDLFGKSFSFDEYFTGRQLPTKQDTYLTALLVSSPQRPLLQLCRSAGRVGALKHRFGGTHIHLWREPRGQWWSYKVSDYFDAATQAIYNAHCLPPVLEEIRKLAQIPGCVERSVNREMAFHRQNLIPAQSGYLAFFAIWLYAFVENEEHATFDICINRFGHEAYQQDVRCRFAENAIDWLDFSDARMPMPHLSGREQGFYSEVEHRVSNLFVRFGYKEDEVAAALHAFQAIHEMEKATIDPAIEIELSQLRNLALKYWDDRLQTVKGQKMNKLGAIFARSWAKRRSSGSSNEDVRHET